MAKNRDKSKLSPGPWYLAGEHPVRGSIKDANGYDICVIDAWTGETDARAIAAAREMYDVCHALARASAPQESALGALLEEARRIVQKIEAQNAADKA